MGPEQIERLRKLISEKLYMIYGTKTNVFMALKRENDGRYHSQSAEFMKLLKSCGLHISLTDTEALISPYVDPKLGITYDRLAKFLDGNDKRPVPEEGISIISEARNTLLAAKTRLNMNTKVLFQRLNHSHSLYYLTGHDLVAGITRWGLVLTDREAKEIVDHILEKRHQYISFQAFARFLDGAEPEDDTPPSPNIAPPVEAAVLVLPPRPQTPGYGERVNIGMRGIPIAERDLSSYQLDRLLELMTLKISQSFRSPRLAFLSFDVSRDGVLALDELRLGFDRLNVSLTTGQLEQVLDHAKVMVRTDPELGRYVGRRDFTALVSGDIETGIDGTRTMTTPQPYEIQGPTEPEHLAAHIASRLDAKGLDMARLFMMFDVNRSGFISMNELHHILPRYLNVHLTARQMMELEDLFLADGGGRQVSWQRFVDWVEDARRAYYTRC